MTPQFLSYKSLFNTISLRLSERDYLNRFIVLSILKSVFISLLKTKNCINIYNDSVKVMIFDNNSASFRDRLRYLAFKKDIEIGFSISRDYLRFSFNKRRKIILISQALIIGSFLFPISFFSSKRGFLALLIFQYIEYSNFIFLLNKHKINKIFFFGSFEIDSNLITFLLKRKNISTTRIPSSNPLQNFYKYVYADEFYFTAPFHKTQFNSLRSNWIVNNILEAPFEFYFDSLKVLNNKNHKLNKKINIGFISSGIWLRKLLNMKTLNNGEDIAETQLLNILNKYCIQNNMTLIILLHPIEKKEEHYDKVMKNYKNFLTCCYIISETKSQSYEYFNDIDLCVTNFSSTGFIRLYAHQKVIFAPLNMVNNFASTKLDIISANNSKELILLIEKNTSYSVDEFFKKNELENYSYKTHLLDN